jgi:hypothetical protein
MPFHGFCSAVAAIQALAGSGDLLPLARHAETFTARQEKIMGIQSTDIFKTDGSPGIEYMAADETWTINAGVVGSRDSYGVHSSWERSTLINNGNIFSGSLEGVLFTSGGGRITNNAGASIAGHGGISFYGNDGIISNHGAVTGYLSAGILLGDFARNVVLNNDGEIYGRSAGVSARSFNYP